MQILSPSNAAEPESPPSMVRKAQATQHPNRQPPVCQLWCDCRALTLYMCMQPKVMRRRKRFSIVSGDDQARLHAQEARKCCHNSLSSFRAPSAGGNPYTLTVVPKDRVNGRDHFSISATGVCRIGSDHTVDIIPSGNPCHHSFAAEKPVCPPHQAAKHALLCPGEWLRQQTMFELLSAKRLFRTWRVAKSFKLWHHNTRQRHYAHVQQSLAAQSFLAKPTFCRAVSQLRNIIHDMAKVQLLDMQPNKAYRLEVGHSYYAVASVPQQASMTGPCLSDQEIALPICCRHQHCPACFD